MCQGVVPVFFGSVSVAGWWTYRWSVWCAALLLGSNAGCAQPEEEARSAPELEGVDEVSPEDTLIVVPLKTEAGANSARVGANGDSTATDDAGGEQDDNASDSSMNEDEEDEEDEDLE